MPLFWLRTVSVAMSPRLAARVIGSVQCWLAPPLSYHWITGAPRSVEPPWTSMTIPLCWAISLLYVVSAWAAGLTAPAVARARAATKGTASRRARTRAQMAEGNMLGSLLERGTVLGGTGVVSRR